jgi:hypothetical protein
MKNLNTFPIEDFLDKARIAIKTNQKSLNLSIKEVADLQNSLSVVMTRLAGELEQSGGVGADDIVIKLNGGTF